jgi:predicted metal-dependent phosphoesterase TrpH
MKNFLNTLPSLDELRKKMNGLDIPEYREVNAHIHTPYSFSAFPDMGTIFRMASDENVKILGINDFYVADGYDDFHDGCIRNNIFPLFNIEFIGLLKDEQKKGIRINDPNNPGRIYFCGKGLDYPFQTGFFQRRQLKRVISESQLQIREMIDKLNRIIRKQNPSLNLTYESIKKQYARELVRERHLAKAVRILAEKNFTDPPQQLQFFETLYGNKKSKTGLTDKASLENEIRSNLLKSGGAAFVEENERSFLELGKIIKIIIKAGGIPCYPVLLDDSSGKYTEFEADPEKLFNSLRKYKIECIELIPGRNHSQALKEFVGFFNKKGFIITFGTEHNTPELTSLTVKSRGSVPLDDSLKEIAYEGACVIAAHQYLRADGRQGYVLPDGTHNSQQKMELARLGQLIIEYYLTHYRYEA